MSYPRKTDRSDFGPEPKNRWPVRSPQYELDAETVGRLMFFQLAGLSMAAGCAQLVVRTTAAGGGSATLLSRYEGWNPRQVVTGFYTPPQVTRVSAGVFDIEYAASVPDFQDVLTALEFTGGEASYTDDTSTLLVARVVPTPVPSSKVRVRGWLVSGSSQTPTDGTFLVTLKN
jgi:hypothetical protein